jgi:hypothetical protein
MGGGDAPRRPGPVPRAGAAPRERGMAVPARMGARRSRDPRHRPPHGPRHHGPGRGAGEHLREHDIRVPRARRRLLADRTPSASSTCPSAVFGVALGTIATTGLARRAAAGDMEGMRETLRQVAAHGWPSSPCPPPPASWSWACPSSGLLFERGRFRPARHREHRGRARALRGRPRGVHGGEGAGPRVLFARPSARAPAGQRPGGGHEPARDRRAPHADGFSARWRWVPAWARSWTR